MDTVTGTVAFGSSSFSYSVVYSYRKTIGICVKRDGSITARAPYGVSMAQVGELMQRRAGWVVKQLAHFQSYGTPTPKRNYVSGETYLFMGKQYILKVIQSNKNGVYCNDNVMTVHRRNNKDVKAILDMWYRNSAIIQFPKIAEPIIRQFEKYGVKPAIIKFRDMKTRWGSCSSKGNISLNIQLIRAPKICIEYVITHEMCHLIHHNHSVEYYNLLTKEMPEWKQWKALLEKTMV